MTPRNNKLSVNPAFTIIELLVVISVIGILAAITLVSYSGVSSRANVASLVSDLNGASTQLKMFSVENSNYPSTISTDCVAQPDTITNKCLKASINTIYSYSSSPTNRNINCLEATKGTKAYSITQEGKLLAGPCPILSLDAGSSLSYPGDGNNKWYDLSGNDNNGTLNGGFAYSSADGGSMGFDGVSGYVSFPVGSITSINGTNSFTINFHARMYAGSTYYPIFNKGVSGVPQRDLRYMD